MASIEIKGFEGRPVSVEAGLFINNEFVEAAGGNTVEIENPTTAAPIGTISAARKEDVDRAVTAAQAAFDTTWKATLPATRGKLLNKLADLIERDGDELASLEAVDAGILFAESRNLFVPQSAETLRHFAGWADKITGHLLHIPQGQAYTLRQPIGVCAAVIPWNSPLMITCWKIAAAIATGNTLIIKTPELAPLYGQKLASLIREAGFPPGVINILCGLGNEAGQALAEHPNIRKIAFTGSGPVGRRILRASADTNLKKVTLELGGKGASIVFGDADVDNAVSWTGLGITANNGQICAAGSRIYVHASNYDRFLVAFAERIANAEHGDPLNPGTTKGPVVSKVQREKILGYVERAKKAEIKLLAGGEALSGDGHFVANTAFADVPEDAQIMQEEIFGPVASIAKFEDEEDVVRRANASMYGLASAIFTTDVHKAQRVSAALESGMVTVNCWGTLNANTPFGGVKQSGFGRDMGEEALDSWLVTKVVKYNLM